MKPENFTAWALGELSPEERLETEAALHRSPAHAQRAAEVKAFCHFLNEHLAPDDASLTEEQRQTLAELPLVETPAAAPRMGRPATPAARPQPKPANWALRITGIAASIVVAGFVIRQTWHGPERRVIAAQSAPSPTEGVKVQPGFRPLKDSRAATSAPVTPDDRAKPAAAPPPTMPRPVGAKPGEISAPPSRTSAELAVAMNTPPPPIITGTPAASAGDQSIRLTSDGDRSAPNTMTSSGGSVATSDPRSKDLSRANAIAEGALTSPTPPARPSIILAGRTKNGVTPMPRAPLPNLQPRQKDKDGGFEPPQIPSTRTGGERYARIVENKFVQPASEPLSTFGLDVDTASYSNVRRFLNQNSLPPPDAVRLEELINYFPYQYETPAKDATEPFAVHVDLAEAPWNPSHRLARIGVKGREAGKQRPAGNYVFLVDVSGSMADADKLPLVQHCLRLIAKGMTADDHIAIVTYAGSSGVALKSTSVEDLQRINDSIRDLHAGGSTNGAGGIRLAYDEAQKHFVKGGINRVILCTDGDFNVGVSSPAELEQLIKQEAGSGVFLSVLGFGTGNLQDEKMMTLADKGNGAYAYIDSAAEAKKVCSTQLTSMLFTIAKDVKVQVEFNPAQVRAYRLLGYEKRALAAQDFNNDRIDAGEIGAGHTVTALYEIVPIDAPLPDDRPLVDDLRYQPKPKANEPPMLTGVPPQKKLEGINDEVMTVKLRYKEPDGVLSKLIEVPVRDAKTKMDAAPGDFRFAAALAGFGMMLRDSEHRGQLTWDQVRKLAITGKGSDDDGQRGEFIQLIDKAAGLSGQP